MKTPWFLFCAILLCYTLCRVDAAELALPAPQVGQPVTQDLLVPASGKIRCVRWIIQTNSCVVDICFPGTKDSEPSPEHPGTQVWLLKANGTIIPCNGGSSVLRFPREGWIYDNVGYSFPLSAKTEACAAVVSVGGQFFVEPLLPIAR